MTEQRFGSLHLCAAIFLASAACLSTMAAAQEIAPNTQAPSQGRSWLKHVRIAAYPLSSENADQIVQRANENNVYGIEVDNDIPGHYESLQHPEQQLEALRKLAIAAHKHGQKAFVYVAGFECITKDAASPHTLAKDHPDWLQRNIAGQPAIFGTKAAFWIAKGAEDTWVSPYAADWRTLYMSRIKQIAATGIDGIYVDIPYWMTHFTGWEDTWASFDSSTVAAFKKQTGLDATKDIKLGDFEDPGFRKWVDFRIESITQFLADLRRNAVSINPSISIIPEIYPGIEPEAVRVGADVYQIYPVVDAISHEYEFGNGKDHTAAYRAPFDWFMYQIGMRSFRAFAEDKPTWMLNYSWDGAPNVKPSDAMQMLFMSELMAGANVWDASGHVMSGSNDLAERRVIYKWIAQHQDVFDRTRTPLGNIGVYFSDSTRNYYPKEFIDSYRGALLLLLQTHRQFQIVTSRTLSKFKGKALILPGVRLLSDEEVDEISRFAKTDVQIVATGTTDRKLDKIQNVLRFPNDPGRQYLAKAEQSFATADPGTEAKFLSSLAPTGVGDPRVTASRDVVVNASSIDGVTYLFLANFAGIKAGSQLIPTVQTNVRVDMPASFGTSMHLLPFLGNESVLHGSKDGDHVSFTIPRLERGTVLWGSR
jgi:hypothetical protein